MDLHTRTVIEIAMIDMWAIVLHQRHLTACNLQGHEFEAQQAAMALARLGRLLLDDQEELQAITERRQAKLVEFSEHESVRRG